MVDLSARRLSTWPPGSSLAELDIFTFYRELETRFNRLEPQVLAFLPEPDRFPRLRSEAQELMERYPPRAGRPPLFGLPLGVKDIFHMQGFITRAGSRLPPEILRGEPAESVGRLKDAGALVLGKTVTTEFAYFAPGPTRNPHHLAHTPGGSSSGSAAAVAAGLCPLALGTQTIGSIIRPAAFCGVLGFKPSYDRISRAGVIPLAPSVDHVGLFATDLGTLRVAAGLLCAAWVPGQPDSQPVLGIPSDQYLQRASSHGLEHFWSCCARLERAGFTLRSVPALTDFEEIEDRHNRLVAAEAARVHAEWYRDWADRYHPRTAEILRQGQLVTNEQLERDLPGREQLRAELSDLMDGHGLDVWISPSAVGSAPRGLERTGDPVMNLPWTHAGLPTINLPAGKDSQGLPLGLQVTAGWYRDEALLNWAEALGQAVG